MVSTPRRVIQCAICYNWFIEHDKEVFNVCRNCQYLFDENLTYVEPYLIGITDDYWIHDYLWVTPEDAGLLIEIHIDVPDIVDDDTKHFIVDYLIDWYGDLHFERFGTW